MTAEQVNNSLEKTYEGLTSVFNNTLTGIFWVIALPIRFSAWVIVNSRKRRYDPEKDICPGCGYRGESGSNYKTCRIECVQTIGIEKAAIKHSCLRCSAEFFTSLAVPADRWIGVTFQDHAARVRAAASKEVL